MDAEVTLRDPVWLLALLAIPALLWIRRWRSTRVFLVPFAAAWHRPAVVLRGVWPWIAVSSGFVLLTLGLARPQRMHREILPPTQGCDIMLAVDVSASMGSEDYEANGRRINRLEAVTTILEAFITRRPYDRIGVVVFSGRAYTLSPPTLNHAWLARQLGRLRVGMLEEGTAIGDAVAVSLRRLESSASADGQPPAASFIVLLTDGANNSGVIDPLHAAALAQRQGVPVYTIATGSHGVVRIPLVNKEGRREVFVGPSELDEVTLWKIAHQSGGRFFRAEWPETIDASFRLIDQGQTHAGDPRIIVSNDELFPWLAVPGVLLALVGAASVRFPGHRWVAA